MTETQTRFVRVSTASGPQWAVVDDEATVYRWEGSPFAGGKRGEPLGHRDEVALLAPIAPSKIICVGRNYPAHAAEHGADVPEEPLLFFKPPSAVVGPGAEIVLPSQSEQVEYEAELVIVIGRRCRDVRPDEAWAYVLGVTCGNDVTARDLQRRDDQWARAKGFDTFCPLGPWLVTGLRAADVTDVEVVGRVNGELRQRASASEMVFSPADLIAYASSIMTLEPGDVIMTGTPEGVGPLGAGDVVEVAVEGIGVLQNPVVDAG
jgi:2-keto-4-pentenoate hydratase/2-oxohepta-3-ene-1,7-dioic acid hydratase in catechol pathway